MKIRTEQRPVENIEVVINRVFQIIGKKIDTEELRHEVLSDPNFPSIQSILNVLQHYKVNSIALKLPIERIQDTPLPLIVHIKEDLGRFAVIEKIENNHVNLFHSSKGLLRLSLKEFLKLWTGACIVMNPNIDTFNSSKKISEKLRMKLLLSTVVLSVIFLVGIVLFERELSSSVFLLMCGMLLINLTGLSLSFFTLIIKLDQFSVLSEKLCKPSKNINCGSVINSKGGLVFGIFDLSDLSIVFFLTNLFIQVAFLNEYETYSQVAFVLFSASVPFVVYSVYYQTIKLHQWCKICLFIGALQILGFGFLLFHLEKATFNLQHTLLIITLTIFALSVYFLFKPMFIRYYNFDDLKIMVSRFKKNPRVLLSTLDNQPTISHENFEFEVTLGNDTARKKILFVGQENCSLCKLAFKEIVKINRNDFDLQIVIRFIPLESSDNYRIREVVQSVITGQREKTIKLINQFFGIEEYDPHEPQKKLLEEHSDKIEAILTKYKNWVVTSGISGAPTIFYNDRKLPLGFEVNDIVTLLKN